MLRPRAISLLALLVASAAAIVYLLWPEDPWYAGKSLNDWLDGGYEDATMALHETGPAAVRCIFAKLRREHPVYGRWEQYRQARARIPMPLQQLLPQPKTVNFEETRACTALLDIGPRAIPFLSTGLRDSNPAVRITSAWALGEFWERGCNINAALPALTVALKDENPAVRQRAQEATRRHVQLEGKNGFQTSSGTAEKVVPNK